ncbi:sulfurtransferase [Silanimonas sp.]|jgi:thiosulfate/3-mercaptopyruvate sulfurtransferase|uniref:sulfurtransferase n=1 Tax=Silanimonas sp. TaxID=1929290 RepID=UPI0037C8EBD6
MTASNEPSPLVDIETLRARLGAPSLRVIDARFDLADADAGRRAFAASRIPGAVYAHLDDDLSDHAKPASEGRHPLPDADRFAATLARWRITPATPVVVYDGGSGAMAAARAWWLLRWMGHADVRVLDGGFAAWTAASAPMETAPADVAGAADEPWARLAEGDGWRPGSTPTVDADAVAARGASVVLVDARARERFRGDVEPLDPKAGHIPGAINRPFAENLAAGRFKPRPQLQAEWRALLPEDTAPWLSCGSGVTACHNALALVHAGWPMPTLFAPSWSGWVSDPARPVATGD